MIKPKDRIISNRRIVRDTASQIEETVTVSDLIDSVLAEARRQAGYTILNPVCYNKARCDLGFVHSVQVYLTPLVIKTQAVNVSREVETIFGIKE